MWVVTGGGVVEASWRESAAVSGLELRPAANPTAEASRRHGSRPELTIDLMKMAEAVCRSERNLGRVH